MNALNKFMFGAVLLSSGTLLHAQTASAPAEPVTPVAMELPMQEAMPAPEAIDLSKLSYSNKWRIKFDNRSDSDGVVTFQIVLKEAQPLVIAIDIKKGTSENSIAKLVKDKLKAGVPKGVKVERDDGEDVLVKYKDRFSLSITGNTVKDLDINLDKE